MPAIIVAVVAAATSFAVGAALAGTAIAATIGAFGVALLQAAAGFVVSYGLSHLLGIGTKKTVSPTAQGADRKQTIKSGVSPRIVVYGRALVSGPVVYIASSGTDNEYIHLIVCIAGHVIDGYETILLNATQIPVANIDPTTHMVTSGPLANLVRLKLYDGTQTTADPDLIAEVPSDWASNRILTNIAYIYARIQYSQDQFPYGFQTLAAAIRGKPVLDPRSGATAFSDNAALCIQDYLLSADGLGAQLAEIDSVYMNAAANHCDETVLTNIAATSFQARYQLNGSFTLDQTPVTIMDGLLTSCAGTLSYVQGLYRLNVGVFDAATVSLGVGDFAGDISIVTKQPRKSLFNTVTGTFIDPTQTWSTVAYPQVQDPNLVSEDGNNVIPVAFNFLYTSDAVMAQRLARLYMLRTRVAGLQIKAPLKYGAIRMAAWDVVAITLPDLGWAGQLFRVLEWQFDPVSGVVTATMQAEDPAAYTWNAIDALPPILGSDSSLASPLNLTAPASVTLTQTTAVNNDGNIVPAVLVTWATPPNPWVTATEIQWQQIGDTAWSSDEVAMPTLRYAIEPVIGGVGYNVRVRYEAGFVRGPWSFTANGLGAVKTTPPGIPTNLQAFGASGAISLTWTQPPDYDLAAVEVWEDTIGGPAFYYVGESTGTGFLRSGLGGNASRAYVVRSRDRSRNTSQFTALVTATSSAFGSTDFASTIAPVLVETSLPTGYVGPFLTLTTDSLLYRWNGSSYIKVVNAADVGIIPGSQLQADTVTADKLVADVAFYNSVTSAIGSFGGLRATELYADSVFITSSLQVGDSVIGTSAINTNALSDLPTIATSGAYTPPNDGNWYEYLTLTVNIPAGAKAVVLMHALVDPPGSSTPSYTSRDPADTV